MIARQHAVQVLVVAGKSRMFFEILVKFPLSQSNDNDDFFFFLVGVSSTDVCVLARWYKFKLRMQACVCMAVCVSSFHLT